jgi:hypothetical protein
MQDIFTLRSFQIFSLNKSPGLRANKGKFF